MAQSPPAGSGRIFISYRREETAYPAGWLFDRLSDEFSPGQIFKDVDSIDLGDDFVEVITAVGFTDVLLALIGHQWLTITGENGRPWQPKVLTETEAGAVRWIARSANGQLVAVGETGPDAAPTAAVWTSVDGSDWRAVDAPALAGAKSLHGVTALGSMLLAVGFRKATTATPDCGKRRQSALFMSTDEGRTWQARRSSVLGNAE
jgi:hypothetical protein